MSKTGEHDKHVALNDSTLLAKGHAVCPQKYNTAVFFMKTTAAQFLIKLLHRNTGSTTLYHFTATARSP